MRTFGQLPRPALLRRFSFVVALALVAAHAHPASAQTPAATKGNLVITVTDPSGGVIPSATVTLAGLDDATKGVSVPPATTSTGGSTTFEGLVPGRYNISAAFPGFEVGLLRSVQVTAATTSTSWCCRSKAWRSRSPSGPTRKRRRHSSNAGVRLESHTGRDSGVVGRSG